MQKSLDDNDILMYSTHNKGKLAVAKRFTKTLKSEFYKTLTANDSLIFVF